MSFGDIIGQEAAIKILREQLAVERINHAYLFTGKDGVGKKSLARQFARALMCSEKELDSCDNCVDCRRIDHFNHPDVRIIEIEAGSNQIKIDQIRELQKEIAYKPYEGGWKVYIIDQADRMTSQAANSVLKTLEEPPGYVVIILLAEDISRLLTTVISRCQQIKLQSISREMIKEYLIDQDIEQEKAKLISMLAEGSLGQALNLTNKDNFLTAREKLLDFLLKLPKIDTLKIFNRVKEMVKLINGDFPLFNLLSTWYRDIMIYRKGNKEGIINYDYLQGIKKQAEQYTIDELISIIELINKYHGYIERNVRKDLTLQVMLLKIRAKRV